MSVDKFGRHEDFVHRKRNSNFPHEGFYFPNTTGNYDIKKHILRNVGEPIADNDAVHLKYIKENCLTKDKDDLSFDTHSFKITNLGDSMNETDAVNVRTLRREVKKLIREQELKIERLSTELFQHVHRQDTLNPPKNNNKYSDVNWDKIITLVKNPTTEGV